MAYIKTKYFGGIGAINDSFAPCVWDFQGFGEDCKASIIKDYLQPKIALQVIDDQILRHLTKG
jgi:hypothetical protein